MPRKRPTKLRAKTPRLKLRGRAKRIFPFLFFMYTEKSTTRYAANQLAETMYEWKELVIIWRDEWLRDCKKKELHEAVQNLENTLEHYAKVFVRVEI